MWFTDPGTHGLGSISMSGRFTTYTAGLDAGSSPGQLVVGVDGDLWFTDDGPTPPSARSTRLG